MTVGRDELVALVARVGLAAMAACRGWLHAPPPRARSRRTRAPSVPSADRDPCRSSGHRPWRFALPGAPPPGASRGPAGNRPPIAVPCRGRRAGRGRRRRRRRCRAPRAPATATSVPVVRMDAARADQADQVEAPAGFGGSPARVEQCRPLEERAVVERRVDALHVRQHGPAGAEVQVADLGVAHLTRGQPDRSLRRAERRARPGREHGAPGRHASRTNCIRRRLPPDPEPFEDHEHDRAWPTARTIRRGPIDRAPVRTIEPGCHPAASRRARGAVTPGIARRCRPSRRSLSDAPPTSAPSMPGSISEELASTENSPT